MIVSGADVTEEEAEKISQRELKRVSRKFTHMTYHALLTYFPVLKRLGWVGLQTKLNNKPDWVVKNRELRQTHRHQYPLPSYCDRGAK